MPFGNLTSTTQAPLAGSPLAVVIFAPWMAGWSVHLMSEALVTTISFGGEAGSALGGSCLGGVCSATETRPPATTSAISIAFMRVLGLETWASRASGGRAQARLTAQESTPRAPEERE